MLSLTTFTGKEFYPFEPHEEQIDIKDIAHSLSFQCRYAGHINNFFSVAQHSVIVSLFVPEEYKLCGLMHDASEAYLTDVPTPIKDALPSYKKIEDNVMSIIANKYNFQYPEPYIVKSIDKKVFYWESYYLFPNKKISRDMIDIEYEFVIWDQVTAERKFLEYFNLYSKNGE